nr:MAG TPA: hypothetical protein [Caudoviricetes sp.]
MVYILLNDGIHLSENGSLILDLPVYLFSLLNICRQTQRETGTGNRRDV